MNQAMEKRKEELLFESYFVNKSDNVLCKTYSKNVLIFFLTNAILAHNSLTFIILPFKITCISVLFCPIRM